MLDNWVGKKGTHYSDFVWRAATRSSTFATFRREARYARILENVSAELGEQYLSLISDPMLAQICLDSETADKIGGPRTATYNGRNIAPSTLRYGKIANDIIKLFPEFDSVETICEIGCGYGGQARILCEYGALGRTALRRYTLVDLPEVLSLANRYLGHFHFRNAFDFLSKTELSADRYDLAISNYAFSEFARPLQHEYLEKVLLNATSGYLIMNSGAPGAKSQHRHDVYSQAELLELLPNAKLTEEFPRTSEDNYVIVYGRHDA